jgi:type I restriction enzyme S subunit
MDIPQGYKQTELGVIPDDWEVKKLGDCLIKNPDYGINASAVPYADSLFTYIRITDISEDGNFLHQNKVSVIHHNAKDYFLEVGDIVLARTGASTGKSYLYNIEDSKLVFAGFLIRVKPNTQKLHPRYLKGYLETQTYWNWVTIMSMRSGQPGINGNEYSQLKIPLPPLPEQKAIAQSLSDVDALITAIDKLITKKRNIKQGTMQELLTGKKRLPGFTGDRDVKKLGEIVNKIVGGGTPSRNIKEYWNGNIFWATVKDFTSFSPHETEETITQKGLNLSASNLIPKGTLIISTRMAVGKVIIYNVDVAINQDLKAIYTKPDIDTKFLFYCFTNYSEKMDFLASGSTVKGIILEDLKNIQFPYISLAEQKAIAQILSDMDAEIESLEKTREKYKLIKRGIMQELLTGKTRLKHQLDP